VQTMLPSSLIGWGISSLDEDADGLALLTAHLQSAYNSEERSSDPAVTLSGGAAGFGRTACWHYTIVKVRAQEHILDNLEVR
jgi:hypothetical protein